MKLRSSFLVQIVCTTLIALALPLQAQNSDTLESVATRSISNLIVAPNLDGKLDEWQKMYTFSSTANTKKSHKNNRLDWQKAWLAHDKENLYIAYSNQGRIPKNDWWAWEMYLDTDHNPNTGYREFNNIGAEYLLQGNELYQYIGTDKAKKDWDKNWQYIGYAHGQINEKTGMSVELSIPIKWLNLNPNESSHVHVLFYGDNEAFGGEGEDFHRSAEGYFAYHIPPIQKKG